MLDCKSHPLFLPLKFTVKDATLIIGGKYGEYCSVTYKSMTRIEADFATRVVTQKHDLNRSRFLQGTCARPRVAVCTAQCGLMILT